MPRPAKTQDVAEQPSVVALEPVQVRRFYMAELETHGLWMFDRLQVAYPHIAQNYLTGWLRGCMESNEYLFVCTDNVVGLAQATNRPLEPQGFIQSIFIYAKEAGCEREEDAIYRKFYEWGKSRGCLEVNWGDLKPANITRIKKALEYIYTAPYYFTPIE